MTISAADQRAVWAIDASLLSDGAKVVFQLMSDTDLPYGQDAATIISAELGGSLDASEISAALFELWEKGYLQVNEFVPRYPPLPPLSLPAP